MRLSTVLCSAALLIHGIDALPKGGRNPNSPKYQRRARFRRRQHWGPPQGSRPKTNNNLSPVPLPVPNTNPAAEVLQPPTVPVLDPAGSLEGGPVSGLNFLPGFDGNTAEVSVLDITTFNAPTTPCITTVTQTVDVTVLITASRPRPPLRHQPSAPPAPPVTAPPLEYPVELPPALSPNWQPPPHPHAEPQAEFEPQPEPQPLPLPLPVPQPARLPETTEPCPEDEPKSLNFMVVPVPSPAPAVPAPTPRPNPWHMQESPAEADTAPVADFVIPPPLPPPAVVKPPAPTPTSASVNTLWAAFWPGEAGAGKAKAAGAGAVETGFVSVTSTKKGKRDIDCDEDDKVNKGGKPDVDTSGGGGPKLPQVLNGNGNGTGNIHKHLEGPGDRLLTLTRTRTVHHFETKTPTVDGDDDGDFLLPQHPPPHNNIPSFELPLPLPLPPLPPPAATAAPPQTIVTPPPRLARPAHPPVRTPEPHFDPGVSVGPNLHVIQESETHGQVQGQFRVEESRPRPNIQEHGFPEVEVRTTLCADDDQPDPTGLPLPLPQQGPGPAPARPRHIHCGVRNLHHFPSRRHEDSDSGASHRRPRLPVAHGSGGGPLARLRKWRRDYSSTEDVNADQFLLDQFAEETMSLDACYERCLSTQGQPNGCKSYAYYGSAGSPPPRCDLFGEEVGRVFSGGGPRPRPHDCPFSPPPHDSPPSEKNEDSAQTKHNTWFDLECGSPLDEKWKALGL